MSATRRRSSFIFQASDSRAYPCWSGWQPFSTNSNTDKSMPQKFLTTQESRAKITELTEAIAENGGTPKALPRFLTSAEAHDLIGQLEGELAALTARRTSATPPPLPGSARTPISAAAQAMLDAAKAKAEAKLAAEKAKNAIAAIPTAPTAYANADLGGVMALFSHFDTPKATRETLAKELAARDITACVDSVSMTMPRDKFDALSSMQKGTFCRFGGKLTESTNRTSNAELSTAAELKFPEPVKKGRSVQQFMALGKAGADKIGEQCEDERKGAELRQELLDAADTLALSTRREWGNPPGFYEGMRADFHRQFSRAFSSVSRLGPREPTPHDPAPPVLPNAMTAAGFLSLSEGARQGLVMQMRQRPQGRNSRAELKRAYRAASPAEKISLYSVYADSLKLFPAEPV